MQQSDKDRYFRTSSLPLAVFLYAKGQKIAGLNSTEEKYRKEFTFIRTDYLDDLVDLYKWGDREEKELQVSIHLVEYARNELLDRLNE